MWLEVGRWARWFLRAGLARLWLGGDCALTELCVCYKSQRTYMIAVMPELIRDTVEVVLGGAEARLHAKAAGGLGAGAVGVGGRRANRV
jgi:hypothetical protein